jgi:hypothetical protein
MTAPSTSGRIVIFGFGCGGNTDGKKIRSDTQIIFVIWYLRYHAAKLLVLLLLLRGRAKKLFDVLFDYFGVSEILVSTFPTLSQPPPYPQVAKTLSANSVCLEHHCFAHVTTELLGAPSLEKIDSLWQLFDRILFYHVLIY